MTIEGGRELLKKISTIEKLLMKHPPHPGRRQGAQRKVGGPSALVPSVPPRAAEALANLLSSLPADLGAALVIVQHVDAQFARGLAAWLDSQTPLRVDVAREGMRPAADTVLIAVTDDHLVLGKDLALHYTPNHGITRTALRSTPSSSAW